MTTAILHQQQMLDRYFSMIRRKARRAVPKGLAKIPDLNSAMFAYQADVTDYLLRIGCGAGFLDTGMGKALIGLEWGRVIHEHTHKPVLMLAPLAVGPQHAREAARFGIDAAYVRDASKIKSPIVITNYERMHLFDPELFGGLVCDECFPCDTIINVLSIDGKPSEKYIKDIRIGENIINAFGVDVVSDIHRREVHYAVRITAGNKVVTSSPNHPYFTQRGWVGAVDLCPGDYIMETSEGMRLVQEGIHSGICASENDEILRAILLSEMAHVSEGEFGKDPCARSSKETRTFQGSLVKDRCGQEGDRENNQSETYAKPGNASEGEPHVESNEAQTFRAWGERSWFNDPSTNTEGCTITELGYGISFITGPIASGIPDALQARLGFAGKENRHRGGWSIALQPEGGGCEKGRTIGFVRVDGIEILEQGHPELEKYRNADGKLYFYDIGATLHPSFSVNGLLVHNSSIVKSFGGKTSKALMAFAERIPYVLALTATPSPNDHMELGQHSQLLRVMNSNEMLARWFVADQSQMGRYRLKHHGVEDFWAWVASWARMAVHPSDLGYSDVGFERPCHQVTLHYVDADLTAGAAFDELFRHVDCSATSIHKEKRRTAGNRAMRIGELVAAEPHEMWCIWCDTDYEADELMRAVPGAVEVRGSMPQDMKEERLLDFIDGKIRYLVTKPDIAGFGLNLQHVARCAFVGVSFSYERFYQAIRRFDRFGQTRKVQVHVTLAETESVIWNTIQRKARDHENMKAAMTAAMRREVASRETKTAYKPRQVALMPKWLAA